MIPGALPGSGFRVLRSGAALGLFVGSDGAGIAPLGVQVEDADLGGVAAEVVSDPTSGAPAPPRRSPCRCKRAAPLNRGAHSLHQLWTPGTPIECAATDV